MAHEQIGHFSRLSHNFGCIVRTKIRKGPQEIIHIRLIVLHLVFGCCYFNWKKERWMVHFIFQIPVTGWETGFIKWHLHSKLLLSTHQWFCYATSMQEWYKIQILWGTQDDLLVCGMPVWIVGLFHLSPKDWCYIAVHSRVTWQGTIVHVVAVIWERLDTIIIGTSFCDLCVPHWVTHLEHQMTVESFCHSWTLSTHLWKAFLQSLRSVQARWTWKSRKPRPAAVC